MPTFSPPSEYIEPLAVPGPTLRERRAFGLFRHFGPIPVGKTILKNADGSYTAKFYPTGDECDAASVVYLGGHIYEVSESEATALTNAGFGSGLS